MEAKTATPPKVRRSGDVGAYPASPPKVPGTTPLDITPYCSRSPPRRLSAPAAPSIPPPLNGAATVAAPHPRSPPGHLGWSPQPRRTSERGAAPPLSPGIGLSPAGVGSPWGLSFGPAAAAAEAEEEEELAQVGGEPEHR